MHLVVCAVELYFEELETEMRRLEQDSRRSVI
jgi:hypothetical protein